MTGSDPNALGSVECWARRAQVLAVKASDEAFAVKVSTALEVDKKQVSRRYLEMAQEYEKKASTQTDVVWEYTDSYNIGISATGRDISEYVED